MFEELFQDVFSAESNDDSSEVCRVYVVFNMLHIDASIDTDIDISAVVRGIN